MFFSRSNNNAPDTVLAFAGILQALELVQQTAHGKHRDKQAMSTCINSIFTINSTSVEAVYGAASQLKPGLSLIKTQLAGKTVKPDMVLSRYLVTLLHIERKLAKDNKRLTKLQQDIQRTEANLKHFSLLHENIMASLSETYSSTISTLQPRIMVSGNEASLSENRVSDQIRALLLAAMRSAVLWQQLGGSRMKLLLHRQGIVRYG